VRNAGSKRSFLGGESSCGPLHLHSAKSGRSCARPFTSSPPRQRHDRLASRLRVCPVRLIGRHASIQKSRRWTHPASGELNDYDAGAAGKHGRNLNPQTQNSFALKNQPGTTFAIPSFRASGTSTRQLLLARRSPQRKLIRSRNLTRHIRRYLFHAIGKMLGHPHHELVVHQRQGLQGRQRFITPGDELRGVGAVRAFHERVRTRSHDESGRSIGRWLTTSSDRIPGTCSGGE